MFKNCDLNMKDIIALLLVSAFCISIFFPERLVSIVTMEQFERILGTVIGFYFGSHVSTLKKSNSRTDTK